jgi:hypothetical protein
MVQAQQQSLLMQQPLGGVDSSQLFESSVVARAAGGKLSFVGWWQRCRAAQAAYVCYHVPLLVLVARHVDYMHCDGLRAVFSCLLVCNECCCGWGYAVTAAAADRAQDRHGFGRCSVCACCLCLGCNGKGVGEGMAHLQANVYWLSVIPAGQCPGACNCVQQLL